MLCEICKQRESNIQYTEIVDGVQKNHFFCSQCARGIDFGQYSNMFDGEFPLAKLLSGLLGEIENNKKTDEYKHIKCPICKTTYKDFVKDSRFGCKDCYEVFGLLINDQIKQLQGSDSHKGKSPIKIKKMGDTSKQSQSSFDELMELKRRLDMAIKAEEYEKAAEYRDRIKLLTKEGDDE